MEINTLLLFFLTVIPLICTPGPDILFISSQGLTNGKRAALRAVSGVLLGYIAHALLSALGIAALVAASPLLFLLLKWLGIIYLIYLAVQIVLSALTSKDDLLVKPQKTVSLWKGFLTSFLNPKGLLMYLAILPQFISPNDFVWFQALILSLSFVISCAIVYTTFGLLVAKMSQYSINNKLRRWMELISGGLLTTVAVKMAVQN